MTTKATKTNKKSLKTRILQNKQAYVMMLPVLALPLSGKFNFDKFFRELYARTPDVTVLIEVYKDCYTDYDNLRENYEKLNEMINKIIG